LECALALDTLLTDVSLYWFGGSTSAAMRLYNKANRASPPAFEPGERAIPPLGVAQSPFELLMPPRSWVEPVFDAHRWTMRASGGHFAALERPALLAEETRSFFRPLRRNTSSR
jgi:hypothetical protein